MKRILVFSISSYGSLLHRLEAKFADKPLGENERMKVGIGVSGLGIGIALIGGWLSYQTLDGIIGMLSFAILLSLCSLLGLIPFTGFMAYGVISNSEGKPVIDPTKMKPGKAGLVPLGGMPAMRSYKGFGLGVLGDILCGVLSGSTVSLLVEKKPGTEDSVAGHFLVLSALMASSYPRTNLRRQWVK